MNKRLDALSKELGCESSSFKIDTKKIKNKVNTLLNMDLEERKIYMKQKLIKAIVIVAAITVLGATTVFAAINSDWLKEFFQGDTSAVQNNIKTPKQSVSDGRFTLTLEQVLASKYQVLVIYSVEGLTPDAVSELMSDGFENINKLSFRPEDRQAKCGGYLEKEIKEKRTSSKRYWALSSASISNENEEDFYLRLRAIKPAKKISVPMKCNIETLELTLKNSSYGDTEIKMTPLGVVLETIVNKTEGFTNTFFRMKNGEIKTFNELLECNGVHYEGKKAEYRALFRSIMNFSDFKSVIVDNIEYDMKDTTKTKTVEIDKTLYPFEIKLVKKGTDYYIPVKEFCNKIGAAMEWDEAAKALTITYRNSKYTIIDGSNFILKDGKRILSKEEVFFFDGVLVASLNFIDMDVRFPLEMIHKNIPEKDWTWTITP